jgi:uncharacterized delta-60 repeat protein
MIKRLVDINEITRNDINVSTVYRGNVLVWPTEISLLGDIYIVGQFTTYNGDTVNGIVKINNNGSRDTSFNSGGLGFSVPTDAGDIFRIDNRLIVVGNFTGYNNILVNRIVALNLDGSRDTSFVTGTGFNSLPRSIDKQSDGKILIGGEFTTYNGLSTNRMIRLNQDGSKDTSFVRTFNSSVFFIKVYNDDKILVAGSFTTTQNPTPIISVNRMIKLNADGSTDTSFDVGTGFNNTVYHCDIQTDGKIIAVGNFSNGIARLNVDGSIDTSFTIGTGFSAIVFYCVIQADGKILAGGDFTLYNGVSTNRIVRLNQDGSIDTSFNIGTGFNAQVTYIQVTENNKILVVGGFTLYNGVTVNRIVRLNQDGSIDTSLNIGTGFNSQVNSFLIN